MGASRIISVTVPESQDSNEDPRFDWILQHMLSFELILSGKKNLIWSNKVCVKLSAKNLILSELTLYILILFHYNLFCFKLIEYTLGPYG